MVTIITSNKLNTIKKKMFIDYRLYFVTLLYKLQNIRDLDVL